MDFNRSGRLHECGELVPIDITARSIKLFTLQYFQVIVDGPFDDQPRCWQ
jgi:hypothetical protein